MNLTGFERVFRRFSDTAMGWFKWDSKGWAPAENTKKVTLWHDVGGCKHQNSVSKLYPRSRRVSITYWSYLFSLFAATSVFQDVFILLLEVPYTKRTFWSSIQIQSRCLQVFISPPKKRNRLVDVARAQFLQLAEAAEAVFQLQDGIGSPWTGGWKLWHLWQFWIPSGKLT